jgi:hypothetical protein
MGNWAGIKQSVFSRFLDRSVPHVGGANLSVIENPTEEIVDGLARNKPAKLYMAGRQLTPNVPAIGGGRPAVGPRRLEQNYLYSTRAFQAGALAANDYRFFQNAIGQSGLSDGFPSTIVLTDLETNMDVGGQIAQGKNFCFSQIGISFNTKIDVGNISTLLDAGSLRFSKQGDQYQLRHGPARFWPGGTGVSGFSTATSVTGAHNGIADPRAVRELRVPRVIKEKESFAYIFSVPRTTQANDGSTAYTIVAPGVVMTIWLWGGQMDVIPG